MWTPMRLNDGSAAAYGCGWQLGSLRAHRWVGHYGLGTSSAKISRFVDQKLTVIVLSNLDRGGAPPIADDVAGMFLPRKQAERDGDVATTTRLKAELASATVGA